MRTGICKAGPSTGSAANPGRCDKAHEVAGGARAGGDGARKKSRGAHACPRMNSAAPRRTSGSVKLIEVAMPLPAVDAASLRENQGRVSPLQLWWSRKPGAACRAVLLAALLDDPGPERRAGLLDLVARVATGEGEAEARDLLAEVPRPAVLDPFCGGGSIPAEARRLGLHTTAGDLNPVAVLATRALIDYPARFPGRDLAAEVRRVGRLVGEAARRRIGTVYPALAGEPPVAWVWARTTRCPACGAEIPLAHSFLLSTRPGREARAEGCPSEGTVSRRGIRCPACGAVAPLSALAGQGFGPDRLLATVLPGRRYLAPDCAQEAAARAAQPPWAPDTALPERALGLTAHRYGLTRHRDLHTPRQLLALATFADLVRAAAPLVDCAGLPAGGPALAEGGAGASAFAAAVQTYLALALGRAAARWCSFARWQRSRENVEHAFGRPGLAMAWDFAEANPFAGGAGGWRYTVDTVARAMAAAPREGPGGTCLALDAAEPPALGRGHLICTDPPYLDTLPYADMADIFYVWLRPALAAAHPDLFASPLTPKAAEIVADARRHGGAGAARAASRARLAMAFASLRAASDPEHPLVFFYGMKRAEDWETVAQALDAANLRVTAAWPVRTEHGERLRRLRSNAMACTIVLCCRPRGADATSADWPTIEAAMRAELGPAVRRLIAMGIPPVDLPQAAVGPALAVVGRFHATGGLPAMRVILVTIRAAVEAEVADAALEVGGHALDGALDERTAALAHALYAQAMRNGRREDALRYNDMVSAWGAGRARASAGPR